MSKTKRKPSKSKRRPTAKPAKPPAAQAGPAKPATKPSVPLPSKPVEVEAQALSPPQPQPTEQDIAAKAYEIWVAKGRPVGQDAQNWAEAEAALRG